MSSNDFSLKKKKEKKKKDFLSQISIRWFYKQFLLLDS